MELLKSLENEQSLTIDSLTKKSMYIYITHAIAYNLFSAAVEVKEDENKQLLAQLSELKATSETEVNFD